MLLSLLLILLTSNSLTLNKTTSIYYSRIAILGLTSTSYIAYNNLHLLALSNGVGIYGGLFNITSLNFVMGIFIFIITSIILTITAFYPRKVYIKEFSNFINIFSNKLSYNKNIISNKTGQEFNIIEYSLIIIFIITGAVFLTSSGDLISIFLSIELQSYGLYILSTLYRDSELATGSGLTYFLLGGLSSCFILLGSALLYTLTGTTNLDNMYLMINVFDNLSHNNLIFTSFDLNLDVNNIFKLYYLQLSIIVIVVGFLFKISAAPFHFWSPDVYDGIPTIVTTFVAIIAKISIFTFLLEFVFYTESNLFEFTWKNVLILSSLLSLIIGSVLGLSQFRIKRLYAYSTISHVGFILLALSINSAESIQSFLFYILQYSISNLNAFLILLSIGFSLFLYVNKNNEEKLQDQNNSPIQLVKQIKGYFYINPFLAISFSVTVFSFVGIPPIIGFFGKQMILSAALDNGFIFLSLIAILTSVIGAVYYLNIIKEIFFFKDEYKYSSSLLTKDNNGTKSIENFEKNEKSSISLNSYLVRKTNNNNNDLVVKKIPFKLNDISLNSSLSVIISTLTLGLLLFIFNPETLLNLVNILTLNLFKI